MSTPFWKSVKCHGYVKPVHDGRTIELLKDDRGQAVGASYCGIGADIPAECNCEGALEFIKTYYEERKAEFGGVCVGEKTAVKTAYLYADTGYQYNGSEYIQIGKQTISSELCAIVYFRAGQKRLVPMRLVEEDQEDCTVKERHGKWIIHTERFAPYQRCSVCGFELPLMANENEIELSLYRHCPECTARMDLKD